MLHTTWGKRIVFLNVSCSLISDLCLGDTGHRQLGAAENKWGMCLFVQGQPWLKCKAEPGKATSPASSSGFPGFQVPFGCQCPWSKIPGNITSTCIRSFFYHCSEKIPFKKQPEVRGLVLCYRMRIQFIRVVKSFNAITAVPAVARVSHCTYNRQAERSGCWCSTLFCLNSLGTWPWDVSLIQSGASLSGNILTVIPIGVSPKRFQVPLSWQSRLATTCQPSTPTHHF